MKTVLTIDPGVGLGLCAWDYFEFKKKKAEPLWYKTKRFKERGEYFDYLRELAISNNVAEVWCEDCAFMQSSEKGQIAARTGDLVKLAKFIGRTEQIFWELKVPVNLVSVMQWKGQVPKEKIFEWMFRFWKPMDKQASHALDAVAIGFWAQGRL